MARITMRQVASEAGVSPTVVSHILNNTPGTFVAEKTKKVVLEAARKLGYQNSLLSRSIKKSLRHIGIATTNRPANHIDTNSRIFDAFRRRALENNYFSVDLPMPTSIGGWTSASVVKKMIELYRTKLVDGFLIDKVEFTNDAILKLAKAEIPMVMVNGEPYLKEGDKAIYVSTVIADTFQAGELAVEHLTKLGHENIALLSKPYAAFEKVFHPFMVSQLRKGFTKAMKLSNSQSVIVDGDPACRKTTEKAITKLMNRKKRPTAIIAADDGLAVMACQKLTKMGLSIPKDISVVTVGGWHGITQFSPVRLSSVNIPLDQTGELAADLLVKKIENNSTKEELIVLDCKLNKGGSTAPMK